MRRGVWLAVFSCMLLTSCTPAVRQAILPKTDHQLNFVQKGSFYFSEEEERFIQREAQALGIPIPDREEIRKFINYYLSNKRSFELALQRANYYMPIIRPIVQKYNLPEELALLPVIESGFNNFAVSRSGAAGLWQFIPSTARRYGLRVDQYVDERFDVVKATDAAMRYLKDLYSMFGNWELALASYNCGENCVARRTGGVDFWTTQTLLPEETRNYVPAFFAVLLLANNPEKYGLSVRVEGISVAKKAMDRDTPTEEFIAKSGIKESLFKDLNPHIKKDVIPAGTFVYVPKEERNKEKEKVERLPNGAKLIIRE
ncbi:MAG: lytic transglycosylase domain-containing protein [Aquificaceae bacterium]|uniref:Lytic transglycosylase n=1 Tax=Hydrogenobacter sp. TaxID=2152829 RepID=A0A7C2ZG17_9AQUI|nr:lytic transglycosylase domain-containing protein [Aquificaceae bacterium]QWK12965.1 MAG: lytic transglycosylase domain-containing protein [Aquificota bacterium]HAV39545.1 lytic transglycosylase [Aquificaceae bacterium]